MREFNNLKPYNQLLSKQEHLELLKQGMMQVFGKKYGNNSKALLKVAAGEGLASIPESLMRAAIGLTILAGVPAGAVWHKIDQKTAPNNLQEREMNEKIKLYKNLTSNVESTLAEGDAEDGKPVSRFNVRNPGV